MDNEGAVWEVAPAELRRRVLRSLRLQGFSIAKGEVLLPDPTVKVATRRAHETTVAQVETYHSGSYTLKDVSQHFKLHNPTSSGIIKSHKSKT